MHALNMKINLPVIPQVHHASSDEEVEEFYVNLFKQVFETAANSLLRHYQSRPLQMSNILHCLLEDQAMSHDDIKTVSEFYGNWNSEEIVHKCQLLFARLRRLNHSISIAEISKEMRQNRASVDMAPNLHCSPQLCMRGRGHFLRYAD